jgi:hypothetical protein
MNVFKWLVGACGLMLAFCASGEWQGRMTDNEAIDKAGLQRMLSQRILKAYCQLGLGELEGNPQEQLYQAISLFDANLLQLEAFAKDPTVKEAIGKVKETWPAYKALARRPPTPDNAAAMLDINNQLLPLAHDVVIKMEKSSGASVGKWVNLAGRQRMLSQRVAMLYLLDLYGIKDPKNDQERSNALTEYSRALKELAAFSGNTAQTRDLLDSLERGYSLLNHTARRANLSFLVATTSERMLVDADKLTALYVELEAKK